MRTVTFPIDVPTTVIEAETPPNPTQEAGVEWKRAQEQFSKQSPVRKLVYASGSGHDVMRDRPQVVIDSIKEMFALVSGRR